jgi:hypothetical protein
VAGLEGAAPPRIGRTYLAAVEAPDQRSNRCGPGPLWAAIANVAVLVVVGLILGSLVGGSSGGGGTTGGY